VYLGRKPHYSKSPLCLHDSGIDIDMHPPATLTLATSLNYVLTLFASGYLVYYVLTFYLHRNKSTPLRGPLSKSYLFGVRWHIGRSPDSGEVYERWAEEYGPVYRIPDVLGMSTVVIADPMAIAHFYAKETFGYVQTTSMRKMLENMVSMLDEWVNIEIEGSIHRLDQGCCVLKARCTEGSERPSPRLSAMQPSEKSPPCSLTPHMRSHPAFYLRFTCAYSNL